MKRLGVFGIKHWGHRALRSVSRFLPEGLAQASNRAIASFDPHPDTRLSLKIADTQQELEACFKLVHDCQVAQGLTQPQPSGLALSLFNALPSSVVLCAKFDGMVVGTVSLVSESVFGLPMQNQFDLSRLRAVGGTLAQATDLAIAPHWRQTGGSVLWPLLKALLETCQRLQVRHLVAVPQVKSGANMASLLVSILMFKPIAAVAGPSGQQSGQGLMLDLNHAKTAWKRAYRGQPLRKNFYYYFSKHKLPNLDLPDHLRQVSREPVLTPVLLNYFFNEKTRLFLQTSNLEKAALYRLYHQPWYAKVLPINFEHSPDNMARRQFPRFAASCLGLVRFEVEGTEESCALTLVDCSLHGFLAFSASAVALKVWGDAVIHQGLPDIARFKTMAVATQEQAGFYGFKLADPDAAWRQFVASRAALEDVKKLGSPEIMSKL